MRVHGGRPGLRAGNRKRGDQAAPRTPHPALSSLQQAGEPRWTSRKRSGSKRGPTTPQKKFPLKMSGPVTSGPACPFQQSDHRERRPGAKRPRSFSEQSPPPHPAPGPGALRVRPWRCGELGPLVTRAPRGWARPASCFPSVLGRLHAICQPRLIASKDQADLARRFLVFTSILYNKYRPEPTEIRHKTRKNMHCFHEDFMEAACASGTLESSAGTGGWARTQDGEAPRGVGRSRSSQGTPWSDAQS